MDSEYNAFKDLREKEEAGNAIQEMIRTEGWGIFSKWIDKRINDISISLMTCPIDQVIDKRNECKTYLSIKHKIHEFIKTGRDARNEIEGGSNN